MFDYNLKKKMSSLLKVTAVSTVLMAGTQMSFKHTMAESQAKKTDSPSSAPPNQTMKEKPNIVYILLDDAGFSDLGSYGSEVKTPNIDKLAENGLLYNNLTVNPMCSPTRASLLTGRNHHSVGMGNIANFDLGPESHTQGLLKDEAATSGEILKENGYSTFAVSKWHAAPADEITPAGPFDNWPLAQGFERYYGILESHSDQFQPELVYDNHMIDPPDEEDYHLSKDFTDHAIQFVTDQASITPDKPFHLYLGYAAVHSPIQVPQEYIDMYKGVYDRGWDKIREERFHRQKELGIIPKDTVLPPRDKGVKAWDELSKKEREAYIRFQEAYAGFLTHTDEQIGRFVEHLKEIGEYDNTAIFLLSDNGASPESPDGSLSFTNYLNGYPVNVEDLYQAKNKIGGPEVKAAYPLGWAQVSNTPFKNFKQSVHNGGVRSPLIVHWPEGIKDKGAIRTQYHHVTDITATALDLSGVQAPETYQGVEQMPIHGVSMADSFNNENAPSSRKTQYFSINGHRAIIQDGWKAVTYHKQGEPYEKDQWELYDLKNDFSEANNLAAENPEKLNKLKELWYQEAEKYGALPFEYDIKEILAYRDPNAPNNRNQITYYQGLEHVGTTAAPKIQNHSYTLTAKIHRNKNNTEGVLVAHGDHLSGYTLYVKDKRVYYEYNHLGDVYKIVSDKKLSTGDATITFKFDKTGAHQGKGSLYLNDKKVGEVEMPKTIASNAIAEEGLDVGQDKLSPVSENYGKGKNFKFSGKIYKIQYDIEND